MDNLKLLNVLEITSLCESDHDIGILSDSCGDEDFEGGEGQLDSDEVDDVVENDEHEEEEDNGSEDLDGGVRYDSQSEGDNSDSGDENNEQQPSRERS